MKLLSIVGARPQFVKAATLSRAIASCNDLAGERIQEIIVHTGQHFDRSMSEVFFSELSIPSPHHNLGIAGLTHGAMTGRMLESLEAVFIEEKPNCVVVFGDTNSTLAAALAAAKLHIPVAHVEAGLRSFNMRMPEEINRIVADRISCLLLCPTARAVSNLEREGLGHLARNVGDVMYDATVFCRRVAAERFTPERWGVRPGQYVLCTIHRAENTDDPNRFKEIWGALRKISNSLTVLFPVHPRTRKLFAAELSRSDLSNLKLIDPVSYLEMTCLEMSAAAIVTDSGGVQKEAFFHEVPCLTVRDETEWVETVELGWNVLCGADSRRILHSWNNLDSLPRTRGTQPFGGANAAAQIVQELRTLG